MAQFTVYRNRNAATQRRFPLLLDVQSDLLEPLGTRVVIPLAPTKQDRPALGTLTPRLRVDGREYLAMTPQLAGIALRELGAEVANLGSERQTIIAALDMLITGI